RLFACPILRRKRKPVQDQVSPASGVRVSGIVFPYAIDQATPDVSDLSYILWPPKKGRPNCRGGTQREGRAEAYGCSTLHGLPRRGIQPGVIPTSLAHAAAE